jgi:hypothetical protein
MVVIIRLLLTMLCVLFCTTNSVFVFCYGRSHVFFSSTSQDARSMLLSYVQFGDLVQAMMSGTDNMRSRTQWYVSLLSIGNHTGDVNMWCLISRDILSNDHFKILQMLKESQSEIWFSDSNVSPLQANNDERYMWLATALWLSNMI